MLALISGITVVAGPRFRNGDLVEVDEACPARARSSHAAC